MKYLILFFAMLSIAPLRGQDVDIVNYLKQIESGDSKSVLKILPELKNKNKNSPSLIFLEGVLTEDGSKALGLFNSVADKYPQCKYADAAVFRISSYYYALEDFSKARTYFDKLKSTYPNSPYIKLLESRFTEEKKTTLTENKEVVKNENKSVDKREKKDNDKKSTDKKDKEKGLRNKKESKDYKYTVQAAAFSNLSNAEALSNQFKEDGYSSEIKEKNVAGTIFQVVYTGKFETEKEAKTYLEEINKKYKITGRVVANAK